MELCLTGCDFDKTIYAGNSPVDFYLFCLRRDWRLGRYFLRNCWNFIKYKLRFIDNDDLNDRYYRFLKNIKDIDAAVEAFWDARIDKIKDFFWELDRSTMIILTASAEFLIRPLVERLGIAYCLGTEIDPQTGALMSPCCNRDEKLARLMELLPGARLSHFYSDSKSDAPLANIAETAFHVKKNKIKPWKHK